MNPFHPETFFTSYFLPRCFTSNWAENKAAYDQENNFCSLSSVVWLRNKKYKYLTFVFLEKDFSPLEKLINKIKIYLNHYNLLLYLLNK